MTQTYMVTKSPVCPPAQPRSAEPLPCLSRMAQVAEGSGQVAPAEPNEAPSASSGEEVASESERNDPDANAQLLEEVVRLRAEAKEVVRLRAEVQALKAQGNRPLGGGLSSAPAAIRPTRGNEIPSCISSGRT